MVAEAGKHPDGCTNASFVDTMRRLLSIELRNAGAPVVALSMCSYPCEVQGKLASPDLVSLARAAEVAEIDLRIFVLTREAMDVVYEWNALRLASLITHCGFLENQLRAQSAPVGLDDVQAREIMRRIF